MENYQRAKDLLQRHIDKLYLLAEGLLEREVLEAQEIEAIVNNGRNGAASGHAAAMSAEDQTRAC
jgi:ATP-dependent Zn protease